MQATCLLLLTFFYIYFFIYILCFSTLIQTQNIAQCTLRHSLQWHIHSESNVFLRKCTTLSKLDVLLGWVTVSCCNFCTACMVRDREREREGGGGEREGENSNSKTLIFKDSSVRSIWTYLTASPCTLQTQINMTIPHTNIISTIKQLINAVSQFLQMCRNIRMKFLSWAYMYTTLTFFR